LTGPAGPTGPAGGGGGFPLQGPTGSSAVPTYSFESATDTGLHLGNLTANAAVGSTGPSLLVSLGGETQIRFEKQINNMTGPVSDPLDNVPSYGMSIGPYSAFEFPPSFTGASLGPNTTTFHLSSQTQDLGNNPGASVFAQSSSFQTIQKYCAAGTGPMAPPHAILQFTAPGGFWGMSSNQGDFNPWDPALNPGGSIFEWNGMTNRLRIGDSSINSPAAEPVLQIDAVSQGMTVPRLDSVNAATINSGNPVDGMIMYVNDIGNGFTSRGFHFGQTGAGGIAAWSTIGGGGGGVTYPLQGPTGSAAVPTYSFESATDSGMFLTSITGPVNLGGAGATGPALGFSVGGTQLVTMASYNAHPTGPVDYAFSVGSTEPLVNPPGFTGAVFPQGSMYSAVINPHAATPFHPALTAAFVNGGAQVAQKLCASGIPGFTNPHALVTFVMNDSGSSLFTMTSHPGDLGQSNGSVIGADVGTSQNLGSGELALSIGGTAHNAADGVSVNFASTTGGIKIPSLTAAVATALPSTGGNTISVTSGTATTTFPNIPGEYVFNVGTGWKLFSDPPEYTVTQATALPTKAGNMIYVGSGVPNMTFNQVPGLYIYFGGGVNQWRRLTDTFP
jgi:hypothetical protein